MEKFLTKKRKPEREVSASVKKTKEDDAVYCFCVAPGASGGDCQDLIEVLSGLGKVAAIKQWVGNFPSQLQANVALLERTVREAREMYPSARIVLVGHSFGCRIICALLAEDSSFNGAILESYPLYGPSAPKPSTDRAAALLKLPEVPVLFLVGHKDPFLDRKWLAADAPRGISALRIVLKDSKCKSTVVAIDGAGHDVFKVSKKHQMTVRGTVRSAIASHVDAMYAT